MPLQELCSPAWFWWRARLFALLFNLLVSCWFCIDLSLPNSATLKYFFIPHHSIYTFFMFFFAFSFAQQEIRNIATCACDCVKPQVCWAAPHLGCNVASAWELPCGAHFTVGVTATLTLHLSPSPIHGYFRCILPLFLISSKSKVVTWIEKWIFHSLCGCVFGLLPQAGAWMARLVRCLTLGINIALQCAEVPSWHPHWSEGGMCVQCSLEVAPLVPEWESGCVSSSSVGLA